ncbi:MAG: hypothetical protein HYY26_05205 [Acidobacteria bacterium]|nr:hypothetical protein [Acidobacteriota bacterium]
MSEGDSWLWATLVLLGAYHGINPGMGWLFAVALGMQERNRRSVWRALPPLAVGHGLAIGAVVALAGLAQWVLPLGTLKIGVAVILAAFGLHRLVRHWHPRGSGMLVGFGDLTIWSFLMASAHGAGFMLLPFLFQLSPHGEHAEVHLAAGAAAGAGTGLAAVLIHTAGYLLVTGLAAWIIYTKLGVAILRKAWLNLDLLWALVLLATAALTLVL